jgi:hypothetical protein
MNFRLLAILVICVVAVISGCSAKGNSNPGVEGTTGITGTSGGTTGTGTAAPTGAMPGTPTAPGTSDRVRPSDSSQNESDGLIENEVVEKLKDAGLSESSQIDVDVDDGIVTLEGTVTSSEEAERVMTVARSVPNVRNVVSKLQTQQ